MDGVIPGWIAARVKTLRATIHAFPELSFEEVETTALIRSELAGLGYEIIDLGLPTGVVARLNTGKKGPVIGLRADIDAIRQHENAARPGRSTVEGVMHACGHDTHTASLLGAAMLLSEHRAELCGDAVLIFQPGEEVLEGSRRLIGAGLFQKAPMDCLFGLHNAPFLPVGTVGVKHGPLMAGKDDFTLTITGRGGHGGMPHLCIDPIVAAAGVVNALQTVVSRNVSPLDAAVVSVCSIHGGTPENLIVDEVALTGSIRCLAPNTRKTVLERVGTIVRDTSSAYGCTAALTFRQKALSVVNGPDMTAFAEKAASAAVGKANVAVPETVLASEDFSFYGEHVKSFFYFLGSGRPGKSNAAWHSPDFYAAEDTPLYGARLYFESVLAAQRI